MSRGLLLISAGLASARWVEHSTRSPLPLSSVTPVPLPVLASSTLLLEGWKLVQAASGQFVDTSGPQIERAHSYFYGCAASLVLRPCRCFWCVDKPQHSLLSAREGMGRGGGGRTCPAAPGQSCCCRCLPCALWGDPSDGDSLMPIWGVFPIVCAASYGLLCLTVAAPFWTVGCTFFFAQNPAEMTSCRYTYVHRSLMSPPSGWRVCYPRHADYC